MKPTGKIIARVRERQKVVAKHQLWQMQIDMHHAYWERMREARERAEKLLDDAEARKQ